MQKNGILSGLRVIDCGTYIAGPASATVMSDFGAEVFKIERPDGGDLWRLFPHLPGSAKSELNWAWVLTGRNKKSVALDLGTPEGYEALIRLVRTADVFVTNYQPQLLTKFHLTWDELRVINDRLIFAHLTGYGEAGEDAGLPAFDALAYWARSGLMTSVVGRDGTPGGPRPGIGDHPTAMALFGAIMLGLYDRERTGRGSKVGTSLMASGAWAHSCDLQAQMLGATFPKPAGPIPINPLSTGYITRDAKVFLLAQLDPEHEFPRLCTMFGAPEMATDPMFASDAARTEHAAELSAILQSQFESRDLAEWRKEFRQYDIKWAPLPMLAEVVSDPQMRAAGAFVDVDYPGHGTIQTINSPLFVEGSEKRKPEASPEIGANTREVLRSLGYDEAAIDDMIKRRIAAG
ncbi:MAG: CaiB/BaiF CoA-transferase family protein [Candidatus Binatus sp.]|uniref:CaiB/BaiF CoA transferase family protein n=1 Tax=Candidatus Binatus sp. TaxID=2811406 RepID=UPI003C77D670